MQSVGRRGKGPGEFEWLRRIFPVGGDSVGAFDPFQTRITIFGPDGNLSRMISLGPFTQDAPDVLGRLADGRFVARSYHYLTTTKAGTPYRVSVSLKLLDNDGRTIDSVVDLPGADMLAPPHPQGPYLLLDFARQAVFGVSANSVYYGGQDSTGITEFGAGLERVATIRTITRAEAVTDQVRKAYQHMLDERLDRPRGGIGVTDVGVYPNMAPAFGDIVAGADSLLWVQDPFRPDEYPLVWTAYSHGEPVARAGLPRRFFPFAFLRHSILGVSYDDLNVERIEVRRLVEGPISRSPLPPRDAAPVNTPVCGSWASR